MNAHLSTKSLIKATLISLVVAAFTLVLFILPAEYNIDPTGIGQKLGLTILNPSSEATINTSPKTASSEGEDTVTLTVPTGRGIEYKLAIEQFQKVKYEWLTDGADVYVDLHGEPRGDTTGYFESYTIATTPDMQGSFTAPFAGSHGWYFKNKTDSDIQIQLTFSGDYVIEGLK
ncbi:hypothetical protein SOPP22_17280 [Shewanella sp. OPT22]|nr:hypothetical protein SOPP22_17280 [Shewanella sp. OPT22]